MSKRPQNSIASHFNPARGRAELDILDEGKFRDSAVDVVVIAVNQSAGTVDVEACARDKDPDGVPQPVRRFSNVPVCQMGCAAGKIRLKIQAGDIGILFARHYDADFPTQAAGVPENNFIDSKRFHTYARGFFVPLSFNGFGTGLFEVEIGATSILITPGGVSLSTSGKASVSASECVVDAPVVILGGVAGTPVALEGSNVVNSSGVVIGTIQAGSGSQKVKAAL